MAETLELIRLSLTKNLNNSDTQRTGIIPVMNVIKRILNLRL